MPDGAKSPAFYEQRWFKAVVSVLGLTTALLAIAGPLRSAVRGLFPGPAHPALNTQVIFDTSAAMGDPFHGMENRRDAGLEALRSTRFLPSEGVGLRRTDPRCSEEPSDPLVPLGIDHGEEVRATAEEQKLEGRSNLIIAVRSAIAEFAAAPYEEDSADQKRIIVIAAGVDECAPEPIEELEHVLSGADLNRDTSEFKLFGLDASSEEERRLKALERALSRTGASVRVWTPHNVKQLYRDVEKMNREGESRPGVPPGEQTIPDGQ